MEQLFPLTLATGSAFCNRESERAQLRHNILNGTHVWLQAHRRYGKSSLVEQTVSDMERSGDTLVFGQVDLLLAATKEDVARKLLATVGKMAGRIPQGGLEAVMNRILGAFKRLRVDVTLTPSGPRLQFHDDMTPDAVFEALKSLDELAAAHDVRALFYIDEFQNLSEIDASHVYEAAIRSALQAANHVTYIFSGSNRRLMEQAFNDSSRPLYRHCRAMMLERISAEKYREHIASHGENTWGQAITADALNRILEVTERHAFYVNSVCNHLWYEATPPNVKQVETAWETVLAETRQANEPYLSGLSTNQRKILLALAQNPTEEPFGKTFQMAADISVGSVRKTLEQLIMLDLVTRDGEGRYHVIDPAIAELLRRANQN